MGKSFVYSTRTNALFGSLVETAPWLAAVDSTVRDAALAAGNGIAFDLAPGGGDLSALGFSKVAAVRLTLTGSTAITLDLTALAAATGVQVAGDTSFASWSYILCTNNGATSLSVAPGASNPLRNPLTGTSVGHTVAAGDVAHWNSSAGLAVDSTHKTITVTPTSGGSMLIWIGGQ